MLRPVLSRSVSDLHHDTWVGRLTTGVPWLRGIGPCDRAGECVGGCDILASAPEVTLLGSDESRGVPLMPFPMPLTEPGGAVDGGGWPPDTEGSREGEAILKPAQ
jgi:hypothetical protein